MVRIRMQRLGRRNRPFYRINAIDKRTRRNGKVIENLGWYDPIAKDESKQLFLNGERIKYWLSVGAQPSDTVRDFLAKADLIDTVAWEAQRKADRNRVTCKIATAKTEEALAEITGIAGESEASLGDFVTAATEAAAAAKTAVSKADPDAAAQAMDSAKAAVVGAKAADEAAQAAKAAREAAEAEAAAKEAAAKEAAEKEAAEKAAAAEAEASEPASDEAKPAAEASETPAE